MSFAGRWFITPHAVLRYMRRVRPGCSYEQALGDLIHLSRAARLVKRLNTGGWLYRGPKPHRLRLIVEESPAGPLPQLVTVLKGHDHA